EIPIIGVITHCDELEPSDLKKPCDYDEEKYENILKAQTLLKKQLLKYAPDIKDCLIGVEVVSSAVIWNKILMKMMAQICNIEEIKVKFANELIELLSTFVTVISSVPNRYSEDIPLKRYLIHNLFKSNE
ncbi:hypothetical protein BCR32DRAFT_307986, partial [Anaeromyces robustus]